MVTRLPRSHRSRARAIAVAQAAPIVVSGKLWLLAVAAFAAAAAQLVLH